MRKLPSTFAALPLVLIVTFSILSSCTGSLFGSGTSVGGEIASDTTWGPQGSPYTFQNDVTVKAGVTLTILPGTVVDLDLSCLLIDGTLYAIGTEENRISFEGEKPIGAWPPRIYFNDSSRDWNEATGTGCILAYSKVHVPGYQYSPILGDKSEARISNNIIDNYGGDEASIRINGVVANNTILGGYRGVLGQQNTTIVYNIIQDCMVGICCGYASVDPIYRPVMIGNVIKNNTIGIEIYSSAPYIAYNSIVDNDQGITFTEYAFERDAKPVGIINNNIHDNNYNIYVDYRANSQTVDVTNNWWGTTDTAAISQNMYGDNIVYTPVLGEATSNSPTDLPITLALIPQSDQYYAVAAFACGALVGVVALVIWIKKGKD